MSKVLKLLQSYREHNGCPSKMFIGTTLKNKTGVLSYFILKCLNEKDVKIIL